MDSPQKLVSFCIPCKNRLSYLKETLPVNLEHNRRDQSHTEFVLVDFASEDGLSDWVTQNFETELRSGYLRLLYTDRMSDYHMALAKNTAHAFATGRILTNLDADNFTGPSGGRFVYKAMKNRNFETVLHQFSGTWRDGTCGRISYTREHFIGVGGYNEEFKAIGAEDLDLLQRIMAKYNVSKETGISSGFRHLVFRKWKKLKSHPRYNKAIKSPPTGGESFRNEMVAHNQKLSDINIANHQYIANNGHFGIINNVSIWSNGRFDPCQKTYS